MTRFWISFNQGVDFVLPELGRMRGGEIFVPKIPSMRIIDLAKAMAPALPHESRRHPAGREAARGHVSADDSHLTIEFGDHLVITPSIRFNSSPNDNNFRRNALGDVGRDVVAGFEYQSGSNQETFARVPDIREFDRSALT